MIVLTGPTASGKSDIALQLAEEINGEIISADSMQIYKYMDIGTAKISKLDQNKIQHHLIDICEPIDNYSVAQFVEDAEKAINIIESKGKTPIIVGGTGLYINSLVYKYDLQPYDKELREKLIDDNDKFGAEYTYQRLTNLNPELAKTIHPNNNKRVIRALEIELLNGAIQNQPRKLKPNVSLYIINQDREYLYNKINKRVDMMFNDGLEKEVEDLINNHKVTFDCQSMQAIGYKEFKEYYESKINKDELINLIKQHTRNYAKRQQTWFKRMDGAQVLENSNKLEIINRIKQDNYNN